MQQQQTTTAPNAHFTVGRRRPERNPGLEAALARLRRNGVCAEDIAFRIGMSGATLSRIRQGRFTPAPSVARAIAEVVGVPLSDLWPEVEDGHRG